MKTVEKNTNKSRIKYLTYKDIEKMYISVRHPLKGKDIITYSYKNDYAQHFARRISEVDNQPLDVIVDKLLQLPDEDVEFLKDYFNLFDKKHPDRYTLLKRLVDIYEKEIVTNEYADLKEFINDPELQDNWVDGWGFEKRFKDFTDDEKLFILSEDKTRYCPYKKVKNDEKKEILQKSFDIFKRLKNRDIILNRMFSLEIKSPKFASYLESASSHTYCPKDDLTDFYVDEFDIVSDKLLNEGALISFINYNPECFEENVKYNKIMKNFFPENNFPNLKNNGR